MTDQETIPASEYHERTNHSPRSIRQHPALNFENKPTPYKRYTDRPRTDLPDDFDEVSTPALEAVTGTGSEPPERPPFDSADELAIDRETLAGLCYDAAGITTEVELHDRTVEFRAAACTGALYHIDLYLVCGDLPNLAAGVYHYDPNTHGLDCLRTGDYRGVLAAASGADTDRTHSTGVDTAPVTVVTTSEWWRNAWKYRDRTFRHAFWDSGTVVANLLASAHGRGFPASVVLGFADDPIVALLGLDTTTEAPLELVPLDDSDSVPETDEVSSIDPETAPLSPNPTEYSLIHQAWRAGTVPDGESAVEWRRASTANAPLGTREPGDGQRVELDPVDRETASARPLANTVLRRGSCRDYERDDISFRKLSTILDRAVRGTPLDVREHSSKADSRPLSYCDCYLLVNGVEGLEAGTYQYHADAGELERFQTGEFRREAEHLALDQPLGGDAAVCAYFMTDVDELTDALGDRGYRAAQFESALTAGRLYLATYAHRDLGGTGLTFFDDIVTDFFAPRASGQTPTFLYTLGRPA
jgi:SagB-type dehydrogenase family enzyme